MSCLLGLGLLVRAPMAGASSGDSMGLIVTKVRLHDGHLLAPPSGAGAQGARPAIVGGKQTPITQAPWQVLVLALLSRTEGILCGGSILNEAEVLTAGHCVYNPNTREEIPADQIVVGAGTADLDVAEPGEQATLANGVRVHPYYVYNPDATQPIPDDVAVLSLEKPLVFNDSAEAIGLMSAGALLQEGTQVDLTGFGRENPSEELNGKLNAIAMSLRSSRECGGEANALFLCASSPNGSDCFGDSGSALTVPGSPATLAGVTDTGEVIEGKPCLDGSIGGFANVAAPEIRDFIVEDALSPPRAPRGGGVSVHGVPMVGDALGCEPGVWSNSPTYTYAFINSGNGQLLQQGSSSTYSLTAVDIGRTILCQVLATNEGGTGTGRTPTLVPVRPSLHEEEETIATKKREEEAAATKKREEELTKEREFQEIAKKSSEEGTKRHEEEVASKRKQEEEAAATKKREEEKSQASTGSQGVAGFQAVLPPIVPDAQLAGTAFEASSSGVVSLKVTCPAGESSCSGTVTLRTLGAVSADVAAAAKKRSVVLTLATGSFTVAGGKAATVKLHLSLAARALLARSHLLRARAIVVAHDPAGATNTAQTIVTLRVSSPKRGKG